MRTAKQRAFWIVKRSIQSHLEEDESACHEMPREETVKRIAMYYRMYWIGPACSL